MTEQKSTLTREQRQRIEVLKSLAPLVRKPGNGPFSPTPVERFDLCEMADWVLREGTYAPRPEPVVISGETELGAIGLTDEARVEATIGNETQIGVYRGPDDGALWAAPEPVAPLPVVQGKARDEVDLRATRNAVYDAVPDMRVALAEEAAQQHAPSIEDQVADAVSKVRPRAWRR